MALLTSSTTFHNRILRTLAPAELDLLLPHLRHAPLALRQELEQPNRRIARVYFIEEGIASVVTAGPAGDEVETGLIGPEGMTGIAVILGDRQTPHSTFIQASGHAHAIAADILQYLLQASAPLRDHLLRFVRAFLTQMAQTAVANARLTLEGRL